MTDETRWLNDDEQKMWRAFIGMTRLLFAQLDAELQRDFGMQSSAYGILVRLSEAPDRTLRMSDLADVELISRSRLSHAVSRLEELGWVKRTDCPSDKRGTLATLTDEGFAVLERAARSHVESVRTYLFDPLQSDQVEQLHAISNAVLDRLQTTNCGTHSYREMGMGIDPCPGDDNP